MADVIAQAVGWQRPALVAGKVALTLLLSWQLAHLTWQVVAPEPLVLRAPSKGNADAAVASGPSAAQYHLFGEMTAQPVEVVSTEVEAPDTRLRLELLGVTKASRQEASSAIIAPKGGEGEFYRIGDTVQGRTRLAGVYEDKVILDTNGKLETLKFEDAPAAGISARTVQNRPEPKDNDSPRVGAGSLRDRFKQVRNPGEFMELVSEETSSDPEGALTEMGLKSLGSGSGYEVQPGSVLSALQLQPGDIVLSVNGQMLGDPASDQQVLQQVSSEGNARIEVQRGNSRFVVNHSLNQ
ncbi:type II secretion system protein N [Thalassolituus sp. LLYu03]|uniref:type II secretion system protein N n=1 Tax=Thalassolituus sp. LLYu03 TaxID=3421656 RepID=UPI003D2E7876